MGLEIVDAVNHDTKEKMYYQAAKSGGKKNHWITEMKNAYIK